VDGARGKADDGLVVDLDERVRRGKREPNEAVTASRRRER